MGAAATAKLLASLELNNKFSPGVNDAVKSLGKLETSFGKIGGIAAKGLGTAAAHLATIGVAAAAAGAVALAGAVKSGIDSLAELSQVQNATNAVLTSTAGVAGVTAQQVRDMANSLEDVTTVDDKVIQSGENMLLTFTNIGAKAFPQATKAVVDMAIAMNNGSVEGLDLKSTAIQVGKALQDPIKGVTALRKVGVALTDQQQKQIKVLVEQGKTYEAQQIILAELETEFGKAGEAAGKDFGSDLRRVQDAGEELTMALATGLLPIITEAAKFLKAKLADPRVLAMVKELGASLATAGKQALDFLGKVDWGGIAKGLGDAAGFAGKVVDAFLKMPDWAKQLLIGGFVANKLTGGAVADIVGELGKGLIKGVLGMNAGVVNINAGVVNGGGGGINPLQAILSAAIPALAFVGLDQSIRGGISNAFTGLADKLGLTMSEALRPTGNLIADWQKLLTAMAKKPGAAGGGFDVADTGGKAIGEAAAAAMGDAMGQPLFWSRLSLADQLSLHAAASGGKPSAAALDQTWQKGQLEAAQKLVASSLSSDDKLEGLTNLQRQLLEHGTAGDRDVAAKIAALQSAVLASRPMTPGETEQMLRANLQAPVVNVSVVTNVTAKTVADTTWQSTRYGSVSGPGGVRAI